MPLVRHKQTWVALTHEVEEDKKAMIGVGLRRQDGENKHPCVATKGLLAKLPRVMHSRPGGRERVEGRRGFTPSWTFGSLQTDRCRAKGRELTIQRREADMDLVARVVPSSSRRRVTDELHTVSKAEGPVGLLFFRGRTDPVERTRSEGRDSDLKKRRKTQKLRSPETGSPSSEF